jgi:hypothetical protein
MTIILIITSLIEIVILGLLMAVLLKYRKAIIAEWKIWQAIKGELAEKSIKPSETEKKEGKTWMEL